MNHLSKVGRVGFCQCAADNTPYLYFDITGLLWKQPGDCPGLYTVALFDGLWL